mgnify:CR=1 FL=1
MDAVAVRATATTKEVSQRQGPLNFGEQNWTCSPHAPSIEAGIKQGNDVEALQSFENL